MTWGSGTSGVLGVVGPGNSLVGKGNFNFLGRSGVVELKNGNYVVVSERWDKGGVADAGAVTWANGTTGISGLVSDTNSFVGSTTQDKVGTVLAGSDNSAKAAITILNNGNYVISSPYWNNDGTADAGAVTWANGTTGISGTITIANSLVGTQLAERLGGGGSDSVLPLTGSSNYLVSNPVWKNGTATNAGAVTWGSGTSGVVGTISAANSLIGSTANDLVGQSLNI